MFCAAEEEAFKATAMISDSSETSEDSEEEEDSSGAGGARGGVAQKGRKAWLIIICSDF